MFAVLGAWLGRRADVGDPFLDATSTRELRRIELLLATSTAYEHDQWLGETAPPLFFARLVAGAAQRWLATPSGDPALRGVDEAELELFAFHATTVSAVLAALALGLLASRFVDVARRPRVLLGTSPLLGMMCSFGAAAVDPRLLACAAASAGCALALACVSARDRFDRLAGGALAGVLFGVALATASESGAWVAAAASALLAAGFLGPRERAEPAFDVGLVAFAVASVVGLLELASYSTLDGLARAHLAQGVLATAVACFALRRFASSRRPAWLFRGGFGPWLVSFAPVLAWCAWAWTRWDVSAGATRLGFVIAAGVAIVSVFALALVRDVDHEARAVCWSTFLAGAPLAASGASTLVWIVAIACALTSLTPRTTDARTTRRGLLQQLAWGSSFAAVLVLARSVEPRSVSPSDVAWLRGLRTSTPSVGPWNHPNAKPDERILCEPELGPALAYHARRAPLAACGPGERGDESVRAVRALLSGPSDGLVARVATSGASAAFVGYRVGGPRRDLDAPPPDVFAALSARELPAGLTLVSESTTGGARLVHFGSIRPARGAATNGGATLRAQK
ncbi:MAG: hypothetical protein L6Q99_13405 [Planctomycetes bacterium]|nr:hypothetical protein [Planctomycetota bacterium]